MKNMNILIADDHPLLREGLAALITAQPDLHVVAQAHDALDVLETLNVEPVDVLVTDLSMPGMNGIELTQAVRRTKPHVHVIVLSRHSETGYVRQVLQAGASGYVLKQSVAETLIHAIHAVVSGATYLDPVLTTQIAEAFVTQTASQAAAQTLSERESEVVRLVALGYSNKEAAAQLGINVKTVDTYKTRAMDKLGLYGRAALVRYALAQGWLTPEV